MKEKVEKLIADLELEISNDPYMSIQEPHKTTANLGRIGGLQQAILKIKIAFDLPLTD